MGMVSELSMYPSWEAFDRGEKFLICEAFSFWEVFPSWEAFPSLEAFPSWEAFPVDNNMEKLFPEASKQGNISRRQYYVCMFHKYHYVPYTFISTF